jgi:hypothetical protein
MKLLAMYNKKWIRIDIKSDARVGGEAYIDILASGG